MKLLFFYDKFFQHATIYNSYDLKIASKFVKTIKFENTSTTYSLTGKLSFDLEKEDNKNILYKMLVAKACDGCSTAPLTQYKNNEIYQEITPEDKFTDNDTDGRIYIDMRRSKGYTDEPEKLNRDNSSLAVIIGLKEAAPKKLRLRLTGYSQAEYWIYYQTKVILCHTKLTISLTQTNLKNKTKCSYKRRERKKRGKGILYIYKNKILLGKRPQRGTGVVSRVIACLLENIGDVIGL